VSTKQLVLLVLLLYFLVMVAIALSGRKNAKKNMKDAMIIRGQTPLLIMIGSMIGGQMGSGFVVGGAEYGALYGLGGAWYGISCGLSCIICGLFTCRIVYRGGYVSLTDYYLVRYRGRTMSVIYSATCLLSLLAMTAGQLLAGRAIFLAVGLPADQSVMITAVISLIYTLITGFLGTLKISTIQSAVVFGGTLSAVFVMFAGYGVETLTANLPQAYFDMGAVGPELLVTLMVPQMLSGVANQSIFQRITSAKSYSVARNAYLIGGTICLLLAFIPPILGMFGMAMFPDTQPSAVFMRLMLEKLPIVVSAIVLAAIVSAVVGTVNGCFVGAGTIMIHDVYEELLHKEATEKSSRRVIMGTNVVICVLGVLIALRLQDILTVLAMSYSLATCGIFVPYLGGILWKRGTTQGAVWSAICGIVVVLLDAVSIVDVPFTSIVAVSVSAVTYIVVSLLTHDPAPAQEGA